MRVSVIIPTRHRPKLLARALASVRAQNHPDLEVWVADDGDPGQPGSPLVTVARAGLPARVIRAAVRGQVAARNAGVRAATGQIIAFLDDDDAWLPGHLDRLQAAIQAGAVYAYSGGLIELTDGDAVLEQVLFSLPADPAVLRRTNPVLMSGLAYRRELHSTLGYFDPALSSYHDWDWHLRVAARHPLTHVPEPGVRIRVDAAGGHTGQANTSHPRNPATAECFGRLRLKHGLGELPQHTFLSALRDPGLALAPEMQRANLRLSLP
jgi:glycosyltransferase involved in cell wall biosynthesis